jgi:hypothetical protein
MIIMTRPGHFSFKLQIRRTVSRHCEDDSDDDDGEHDPAAPARGHTGTSGFLPSLPRDFRVRFRVDRRGSLSRSRDQRRPRTGSADSDGDTAHGRPGARVPQVQRGNAAAAGAPQAAAVALPRIGRRRSRAVLAGRGDARGRAAARTHADPPLRPVMREQRRAAAAGLGGGPAGLGGGPAGVSVRLPVSLPACLPACPSVRLLPTPEHG